MKVVQINGVTHGSTGRIMLNIAKTVRENGGEAYTFSENRKKVNALQGHRFFGYGTENLFHRVFSAATGISGTGSRRGTKKLLREIDKLSPDILHLHNLHGWYINIPMLFDYIREKKIKTVWTLHDCWGFTAQCSHFTIEKCDKWKTGCYDCPRYKLYPYTWVDRTRKMYQLKKEWLIGVENLTIVTPSEWLGNLVKQSFLSEYDVKVINNGIDLDVFKPTESDFREVHGLQNKKIVLGVASPWSDRKGLDVFIELFNRLDRQIYQIVLVGTDAEVDKNLPKGMISIHRTQNQQELAGIYTAADVFVNPTREENFPTVNIEALACGTPIVTFKTGGSSEIVDHLSGRVVECDDVSNLEKEIVRLCLDAGSMSHSCIERAKKFSSEKKYQEYVALYSELFKRSEDQ